MSIFEEYEAFKPHFYIVKPGFTWVYIIVLISAQKHRLWVHLGNVALMSTHNLCFEQKYEKYPNFYLKNLMVKFSVYLNRLVFIMKVSLKMRIIQFLHI